MTTTTLTWTDEPKEGRYYTTDGKFTIDRIRRSWFVLTQHLGEGAHRNECKGSLKVCKAFAQDIADGNIRNDLADVPPGVGVTVGASTGPEAPETCPCGSGRVPFDIGDNDGPAVWKCPECTPKLVEETCVCSLCGIQFTGFGHNPQPLKPYEERCCDTCNDTKVIPARLARLRS